MESSKLAVKFFLSDPDAVKPAEVVPVFHSWIREQAVPDHLLIDVADYAHVVDGPGTVLVSHEANFYLDRGEGRPGLLYVRKQPLPGGLSDRLATVFRATLEAAGRLEQHPALSGRAKFRTDEVIFRVNDRLLAPNTAETYAEVQPVLAEFLGKMYGSTPVALEHRTAPTELFEVRIKAPESTPLATLLARLGMAIGAM